MKYIQGLVKRKLVNWKGKDWYHQRFDGAPYFMHMIGESEVVWHNERKQGADFDVHYCFYDNGKADWYIEMEDIKKVYSSVIKNGKGDLDYGKKLISLWDKDEANFYEICNRISKINFSKVTNNDLITLHDQFVEKTLARDSSSSIIDGFALGTDQIISDKLKVLHENSKLKKEISFNELFSILTAPVHLSFINEAEVSLIKIAIEVKKDSKKKMELLMRHQNDFFWIHNNYVDAYVLSVEHFGEELEKILKMDEDLTNLLKKIEETPEKSKENKIKYWDFVLQDKELAFLLRVSEDFTKWQDDRKKATLWTMHYGSLILNEICKRVGVSLDLIKYMSPREVSKIFINTPSEESLYERRKNSVFYWDKDGHEVLIGKDADEVRDAILKVKDFSDINDFRGMTACMGKVSGRVKIVKSVKEIGKVEQGDVLVAVMTRPDYVPAMKRAIAIVTDEGGITSHAAIVSREMKIPCIIGTKMATKVLKDGDMVEVNANHGLVKIIRS